MLSSGEERGTFLIARRQELITDDEKYEIPGRSNMVYIASPSGKMDPMKTISW
jgi:hypothetical protein